MGGPSRPGVVYPPRRMQHYMTRPRPQHTPGALLLLMRCSLDEAEQPEQKKDRDKNNEDPNDAARPAHVPLHGILLFLTTRRPQHTPGALTVNGWWVGLGRRVVPGLGAA